MCFTYALDETIAFNNRRNIETERDWHSQCRTAITLIKDSPETAFKMASSERQTRSRTEV